MNDSVFRTNIRMGVVPITDTIQAFDAICNNACNAEQVILDFCETNYIGDLLRGRRFSSRFPHAIWNMNLGVQ